MSSARRRAPAVRPRKRPAERPGPEGGARDANRRARTQDIARAALELFLQRGVEAVSVDDVVRRAKVAKGSFYTYFGGLAELLDALVEPVRDATLGALDRCEGTLRDATTREALLAGYQTLALELSATVLAHRDVTRLYLQERRAPRHGPSAPVAVLAAEIDRRAVLLTDAAHAHGLLRPLAAKVTAAIVVGAVEHLLHRALSGDDIGPLAEVPEVLLRVVVDGLAAPVSAGRDDGRAPEGGHDAARSAEALG